MRRMVSYSIEPQEVSASCEKVVRKSLRLKRRWKAWRPAGVTPYLPFSLTKPELLVSPAVHVLQGALTLVK